MPAEMKKVHIDGVDYEAEAPVIATLHQATTKIDSLVSAHADAMDEMQGRLDGLEAERDQLKVDNAKLKTELEAMPAQIQARADARLALLQKAELAGVEIKADMDEQAIMVACILKTDASFSAEGKSKEYISGRFDAATAGLKLDSSKSRLATAEIKVDSQGKPVVTPALNKIDAAQAKMAERHAQAWKKPTTQAK